MAAGNLNDFNDFKMASLAFGPAVILPVFLGNTQLGRNEALWCGLLSVVLGQCGVLAYDYLRPPGQPVQLGGRAPYDWYAAAKLHLGRTEGLVLLGLYLIGTWKAEVMPPCYYRGGLEWRAVVAQLLLTDALQFAAHRLQHIFRVVFRASHQSHHRITNPRIFDAFDGSLADTALMVLMPLWITAHVIEANLASYIAFGSLYAVGLVLIHSEVHHPWDKVFAAAGVGTPADHHVHHLLRGYNYGHLVTWWDRACETYKPPATLLGLTQRE